jgi:hypothetical protein
MREWTFKAKGLDEGVETRATLTVRLALKMEGHHEQIRPDSRVVFSAFAGARAQSIQLRHGKRDG